MARSATFDALILEAIAPVVARITASIARHVDVIVAKEVKTALKGRLRVSRARVPARRQRRVEMTRWAADARARRVPKFVIEATGLDTKKRIVAKFGENATFVKGMPLPQPVERSVGAARPREVKAKAPTIRKKAAAA